MLETKHGKLVFPDYTLVYQSHGEQQERYTSDKAYWQQFADRHPHFEIIDFKTATFTDAQHRRLKEVEDVDEAFSHYAWEYAVNGVFPDELDGEERNDNHPLKQLQLAKENARLGQSLAETELGRFMDKQEVKTLGRQMADMELNFLMGGM